MWLKAIFSNLFYVSRISFQSLDLIAQANYKHRKAKATFRKTLILNGISSEAAKELSKAYPNPVNELLKLIATR